MKIELTAPRRGAGIPTTLLPNFAPEAPPGLAASDLPAQTAVDRRRGGLVSRIKEC
jgi:hypothetical protein